MQGVASELVSVLPAANPVGSAGSSELSLGRRQAWLYKGSWWEASAGPVTGQGLCLLLEPMKS